MSYPLRPSVLTAALDAGGIELEAHLRQGGSGALFDGSFWPPNPNVAYERLYITTSAVPGDRANEARQLLETRVIPEFILWVQAILTLAPNSTVRREDQHFRRTLGS